MYVRRPNATIMQINRTTIVVRRKTSRANIFSDSRLSFCRYFQVLSGNAVNRLKKHRLLRTIVSKFNIFQVTVHASTREVLAVYAIDEARMELVITLAPNYPLGAVKVECGKQIGGRASSRNVGMQLTIFLTHQVMYNKNVGISPTNHLKSYRMAPFTMASPCGKTIWTKSSREWRSAMYATQSSTRTLASCQSSRAKPAKRNSMDLAWLVSYLVFNRVYSNFFILSFLVQMVYHQQQIHLPHLPQCLLGGTCHVSSLVGRTY